jgi:hypothetical protein
MFPPFGSKTPHTRSPAPILIQARIRRIVGLSAGETIQVWQNILRSVEIWTFVGAASSRDSLGNQLSLSRLEAAPTGSSKSHDLIRAEYRITEHCQGIHNRKGALRKYGAAITSSEVSKGALARAALRYLGMNGLYLLWSLLRVYQLKTWSKSSSVTPKVML